MPSLTSLLGFIAMASMVQFLVEGIKKILPGALLRRLPPPCLSLLVSAALVFMFELNLFAAFGWTSRITWPAYFFTALAISAGADPLHNLFAKLRESRGM